VGLVVYWEDELAQITVEPEIEADNLKETKNKNANRHQL
jgi:hypothetical protein